MEAWDIAEDVSYRNGWPFVDRHGVQQNTDTNISNVGKALAMLLEAFPDKEKLQAPEAAQAMPLPQPRAIK